MRNTISANLSTNVVNEKLHEVNDVFQLVSQTTTTKNCPCLLLKNREVTLSSVPALFTFTCNNTYTYNNSG